ncbi:hypothetical protein ACGGAQ_07685 [Micromonospora sp. NPDC047557]|uniref:hypothetical protein n=1 Tax=Micromonospora sp. NPDC047557 TaxID=3364250 RepID=UPI0037100433
MHMINVDSFVNAFSAFLQRGNDRMKRKGLLRAAAASAAAIATLVLSGPAQAAGDTWTSSASHIGDLCTTGGVTLGPCYGSASFVHNGDHLYVWDNKADGHSVVVLYNRSDTGGQMNVTWNHYGAGTRLDHNMDIPESGYIIYRVCLGEYGDRIVLDWTCSPYKKEYAA